jgi:hypothetical protein
MAVEEVGTQMQRRRRLKGVEAFGDQNLTNGEV